MHLYFLDHLNQDDLAALDDFLDLVISKKAPEISYFSSGLIRKYFPQGIF